MSIANSTTCDTARRPAPLSAVAGRRDAGPTKHPGIRVYELPATCRPAPSPRFDPAAGWQVREEGEYYILELLKDRNYEPDPALYDAAYAHTEAQREAMALLDEAENLLAVLLASVEDEGDSRAMQAEAVLKIVKKKLRKAHTRIDRQEARHRNLFLAYFELKARLGKEAE
jgi:hypothetical protein